MVKKVNQLADITNYQLILEKIKKLAPKVIINATGYNNVDKCEKKKNLN